MGSSVSKLPWHGAASLNNKWKCRVYTTYSAYVRVLLLIATRRLLYVNVYRSNRIFDRYAARPGSILSVLM